jgi:lambda family phage portal protein
MSYVNIRVVGQRADGKPKLRGTGWDSGEYRQMGLKGANQVDFTPPISSAQSEVSRNRARGLVNARDAERNSELVRGALDRKSNTVVGPVLRPNPMPDLQWLQQSPEWMLEYQLAASSAFQEWATDIFCRNDAEGHYHFGGLMWQAFRTLAGPDAEVAGYIGYDRERADAIGSKWATYVHLVDPDRVSTPKDIPDAENLAGTPGKPRIIDGREVDEFGAMRALHVSVAHPSDRSKVARWERIPRWTPYGRPQAFHWFFKRRSGLQRALTNLVAVLSTIDMLGQHSRASLQTAVSHSYMAAYLKTTQSPEAAAASMAPREEFTDEDGTKRSEYDMKLDAYDKLDLRFGSKRLPILGPNDEIKFENLEGSAIDYDPFRNAFLRELASALNVSFEQLSLNFALASYSSTRSSLMEAWRQVSFERTMFTNHVAGLIYDAVIEEAFALGILKEPPGAPAFYEARAAYTRCSWTGPAQGWVDPLKEIEATKGRMGSGVSTLQNEAAAQGGNWQENILQRSMEQKYAEKHGVMLDVGATAATQDAGGDADAENGAGQNPPQTTTSGQADS